MNDPPYIREPVFGRPVYKNPNDWPSLRKIDHYEEPLPPGRSHILTHVHTRVGFDKDRHRLQDPSDRDFRALKTTDAMYFTNKILAPQGQYQIYRAGQRTETRDDLYAP
jgi:hypothetical protein